MFVLFQEICEKNHILFKKNMLQGSLKLDMIRFSCRCAADEKLHQLGFLRRNSLSSALSIKKNKTDKRVIAKMISTITPTIKNEIKRSFPCFFFSLFHSTLLTHHLIHIKGKKCDTVVSHFSTLFIFFILKSLF